jgi:hypothetical protein
MYHAISYYTVLAFDRITEIHLAPTRHRPSDQPLQQAVIGIDGLKKLRLHLNCERK